MTNTYNSKEYALYRLKSRLHFIETQKPTLYEAINEDGMLYCAFFDENLIKKFEDDGLVVRKADIEEEKRHLKSRIDYYEGLEK